MSTDIPTTMRAVEIVMPGAPEVLVPCERPVPVPSVGEVLIAVKAAGINRPDILQREGSYPPPPGASDLPGLEIAGKVAALGPSAQGWNIGDEVCALVAGGGYAEYCVAPTAQCLPVPNGFSMTQAAALPETFFTVWENVVRRGGLAGGERFLVHGGSSGIGTAAIQIAHAQGARVFATAGTDAKCAACVELGAERAINYRTEDFVAVVKELTGGEGVDVILDMVGGDYIARDVKALRPEGRLVFIAFLGGSQVQFDFLPLMLKRITITGSTLRPRGIEEKGQIADELRRDIWPLLDAGRMAPVMDSTYPLSQATAAHARMESGEHIGKIVLDV